MRNYLVGLIWGGVVCALALGFASYMLPMRVEISRAPMAAPAEQDTPASVPAPPAALQPAVDPAQPAAPQPTEAAPQLAPAPEPMLDPAPAADPTPPAPDAEVGTQTATAPSLSDPIIPDPSTLAPAPQAPASAPSAVADIPPLQRYAAAFDGRADKPLYAIILLDTGAPDIDRAVLASLPFPVTFAVDPESPTAAVAMALYRAAGQEVIMLPTSLPQGATAQDVAQSFSVYTQLLPETTAVMSAPSGGFQDDLGLAALVLPEIGAQGRGVVVFDKGLNSAGQIAQREGIPYASIGRVIDSAGESVPVMRRYLDRAVFAAAQDGAAVVLGSTLPDTIAALTQWSIEGRASDVTLAPISALMQP